MPHSSPICFLTSSPCVEGRNALNPANGFMQSLTAALPADPVCVYIASSPDNYKANDFYSTLMRESFEASGITFSDYIVLDRRNAAAAPALIRSAQLLILAGGHVPTQNAFFHDLHLKELLSTYHGVIIGTSAGTMNAASIVYVQPEEPGEGIDPSFVRFSPGLGLTDIMVIPHYQMIHDYTLDGLRLFEDITYPDSDGRCFYALVDGSYLYVHNSCTELRGEAYTIRDRRVTKITNVGDVLCL